MITKFRYAVADWFARFVIGLTFKKIGLTPFDLRSRDGNWTYLKGGTGPALVLIHGFAANKENWLLLAPKLMKHYTLYIPDLLGFGESDRPLGAVYTIEAQAERLIRWADELGLAQFDVMGNSMGGYLAGFLVAQYPNRVRSACLLSPAGVSGAPYTEIANIFLETGKIVLVPSNYEEYAHVINLCFNNSPPAMPEFIRKFFGRINVRDRTLLQQIFVDFVDPERNQDLTQLIENTKNPVLVLWGDQDQLVDCAGMQILKEVNPDIHTELLANAGHCPMIERPAEVYKAYQLFKAGMHS